MFISLWNSKGRANIFYNLQKQGFYNYKYNNPFMNEIMRNNEIDICSLQVYLMDGSSLKAFNISKYRENSGSLISKYLFIDMEAFHIDEKLRQVEMS